MSGEGELNRAEGGEDSPQGPFSAERSAKDSRLHRKGQKLAFKLDGMRFCGFILLININQLSEE